MPNAKIVAPPSPKEASKKRLAELRAKGTKRTSAEVSELLGLIVDRLEALEGQT